MAARKLVIPAVFYLAGVVSLYLSWGSTIGHAAEFERLKMIAASGGEGPDVPALRALIEAATDDPELRYDPIAWNHALTHALLASVDERERTLDAIRKTQEADEADGQLRYLLLNALATLPESSLPQDRKAALQSQIFSLWKRSAPRDFAAYALDLPPETVAEDEWTFFRNWPEGSEAVAADFAREFVRRHESRYRNLVEGNPLIHVLGDWARDDPEAARRWIAAETDESFRDVALAALVKNAARYDYEATEALFDDIASPQVRAQVASDVARSLGQHDPLGGIEFIRKIELEMSPRDAVKELFIQWAAYDIEGVMRNFPDGLSPKAEGDAVYWLGRNFRQADPEVVTEWLRSLPEDTSYRSMFFYPVTLTKTAPDTVIDFMQSHPRLSRYWYAHNHFFAELADVDIEHAKSLLGEVNRNGRIAGIDAIAKQLLRENPAHFDAFMDEFTEQKDRDFARIAFVQERGNREPARAMEMALDIEPGHRNRKDAVSKSIQYLSNGDMDAAYAVVLHDPRLSDDERSFALAYLNEGKKLPHEK